MKAYQPYVDSLEELITEAASQSISLEKLSKYLGSDTSSSELRRLVALNTMRESGAFFTQSRLSRFALAPILKTIKKHSVVLDPACGSGNLLAECTTRLPMEPGLKDTLELWGKQIIGRDLFQEFVDATKGRLILEAVNRGSKADRKLFAMRHCLFPDVVATSIFSNESLFQRATHVVMNPPYTMTMAPADCEWASGVVTTAALFMESCVRKSTPGTHIVAILPDVLRSGSRYEKWRVAIQKYADVRSVRTYGQFDKKTDVHVFIIEAFIRSVSAVKVKGTARWIPNRIGRASVQDHFEVSIGAVVDYRDPHLGPWRRFLVAKRLPKWQSIKDVALNRRFRGKVLRPPFVVVRRTSRPEDENRAVATIVSGGNPVAVENHLVVLKPRDGKLATCKVLVDNLRNPKTNIWLNKRIRCRHLTVSALRDLPWWGDG